MPTVRIDDGVFAELKSRAEPFVDTPNSVLRRILHLDGDGEFGKDAQSEAATSGAPAGSRMAPGVLVPHEAYVLPILTVIDEMGGAAPAQEVIRRVGELLSDQFGEEDRSRNQTGGVRWINRTSWVRHRLVRAGLLAKESPRGIWTLTEAGRRILQEANDGTLSRPILGSGS